jgi:hypothetical protein
MDIRGQCGPCVICGKGGLKEVLGDFNGIQDFCRMWEEWRSVYVLCV